MRYANVSIAYATKNAQPETAVRVWLSAGGDYSSFIHFRPKAPVYISPQRGGLAQWPLHDQFCFEKCVAVAYEMSVKLLVGFAAILNLDADKR